ncbi:primosomal protein N' [Ruminococcus sp.]|uniref:primosomal protein N' n=1 Tax=Ruminococcus sp. TaxID=41978 RepID=UPI0025D6D3E6|nr:primosomal protein N' [Ruminococcus sp.]
MVRLRGVFTVAKVAISRASYSFDALYSYSVPEELAANLTIGMRVLVPFGKGNKKAVGFVARTYTEAEYNEKLKPVISVIDSESLVTDEMMKIIFWLKENTFCTYFDAFKSVVPTGFSYNFSEHYSLVNTFIDEDELSDDEKNIIDFLRCAKNQREIDSFLDVKGDPKKKNILDSLVDKGFVEISDQLKRKVGDESVSMVRLAENYLSGSLQVSLTPKQTLVVKLLEESGCASVKEVCYMTNCTSSILKRLEDKGVIKQYKYEVLRDAIGKLGDRQSPDDIHLNEEQTKAYGGIMELVKAEKPSGALLYGVTGSGKTSVFIKLIDSVLKMGKTAVMLVPEISLTPQMLGKFKSLFGDKIAVMHSSLSLGQRTDEFKRIKNGEARIVIGTRSAIFSPISNVGIIIMDEEGEPSYKSDSTPRYHARDVAIQRCGHNNCVLLMASATPSLESFYYAQKGRFHLFELKKRFSDVPLPAVEIVDMQQEAAEGNDSLLSRTLSDKLGETLKKGEQAILLLNRRGYTTYISCVECRQPVACPNCNIPLTYHKKNDRYMCHYCGYTMDNIEKCPHCGSQKLKSSGVGTQRVEDEIARLFPEARLLRMDADTTSSRYSYEENFKAFENGEYDIMLGTQMIAKGLNFPNVTLVGVISLDKALFTGDFRSYERTFSLLTQVAGRSGRGDKPGAAYIQTFVPDHYVLNLAAEQNYDEFFNEEIALRKSLTYPPFCDICVIGFSAPLESKAIGASRWVTERIGRYVSQNKVNFPLRALGPAPCTFEMINNRYRYRLILKTRNTADFREMIKYVLGEFYKNRDYQSVRIYADINGDIGL